MDGQVFYEPILNNFTHTWRYSKSLERAPDIEYAQIYANGLRLSDACPEALRPRHDAIVKRFKAFTKSFREAKIDTRETRLSDLIPETFLKELCFVKDKISKHVFATYPKPPEYEHLVELSKVVTSIAQRSLRLDREILSNATRFKSPSPYIKYDIFKTRTRRLSTHKGSFPILTIEALARSAILPTNDFFVEFDFNAAEVRTMLALTGLEQPQEDIHLWNASSLFGSSIDRDAAKKRFFAWLYNPVATDEKLDRVYDKRGLIEKFWKDNTITTMFGKKIPCDREHALNYLLQSYTAMLVQHQMIKVHDFLSNKRTFISYTLHDNIVLDVAESEAEHLEEILSIFSNTPLGTFLTNVRTGINAGELQ